MCIYSHQIHLPQVIGWQKFEAWISNLWLSTELSLWLAQCLEFCSRFPVTLFNSIRQSAITKPTFIIFFNIWFLIFLTSFFYNNLVLSLTYPLALLPVPPLLLKSSTISISTTTYFPSSLQHSSAISSSCLQGALSSLTLPLLPSAQLYPHFLPHPV